MKLQKINITKYDRYYRHSIQGDTYFRNIRTSLENSKEILNIYGFKIYSVEKSPKSYGSVYVSIGNDNPEKIYTIRISNHGCSGTGQNQIGELFTEDGNFIITRFIMKLFEKGMLNVENDGEFYWDLYRKDNLTTFFSERGVEKGIESAIDSLESKRADIHDILEEEPKYSELWYLASDNLSELLKEIKIMELKNIRALKINKNEKLR